MIKGRDVWWEDEIKKVETLGLHDFEPEVMDSEDPLFILYTSGSTASQKVSFMPVPDIWYLPITRL